MTLRDEAETNAETEPAPNWAKSVLPSMVPSLLKSKALLKPGWLVVPKALPKAAKSVLPSTVPSPLISPKRRWKRVKWLSPPVPLPLPSSCWPCCR